LALWNLTKRLLKTYSRTENRLDLKKKLKTEAETNPHIKKPIPKLGPLYILKKGT
jgi:hypothetical protein